MSAERFQVGQKVLVIRGPTYSRSERVATVEKVTPTGRFRVSGSSALFTADGYGPAPHRFDLREQARHITEADRARIALQNARNRISRLADALIRRRDEVVTTENAEAVEAFLNKLLDDGKDEPAP